MLEICPVALFRLRVLVPKDIMCLLNDQRSFDLDGKSTYFYLSKQRGLTDDKNHREIQDWD